MTIPLAAKAATVVKRKRGHTLTMFDPLSDRFERIDESPEAWELPFAAPADSDEGDFDFV